MTTEFKLYPMQRQALITDATEVLYGGALGGGKSYLARVASIVYSLEIPGLITYLFRRTFKEVLANHVYTPGGYLEMLKDLIDSGDCVFSKSDFSFTFYNGSRIQLAHSQHESDIYSHQGAQIGFLIVDESTHFSPLMIRFIRSRVRLGSLQVPPKWKGKFPRILYTANPGSIGHHYFKSNFVDIGFGHTFRAPEDEGGMLREYVPAKLTDNKILLQNDPEYAQRVRGMGDTNTVKAMIDGDWEALSSGGFADLWRARFHVIKPFNIPYTWTIDRGYDYGSTAPAACLWFAESNGEEFIDGDGNIAWVPAGTLFQIGELYLANKKQEGLKLTASEQARRIKEYQVEEGIQNRTNPGPADNAIYDAAPGTNTIAKDMYDSHGISWTRSIKSPGSRIQGMQLLRTRLAASKQRPMERPGYFVFNHCYHTIRTLPNLEADPDNIEDINSAGEDHIYDVIRYKVLSKSKKVVSTKLQGT
jgi:hypothetical protein